MPILNSLSSPAATLVSSHAPNTGVSSDPTLASGGNFGLLGALLSYSIPRNWRHHQHSSNKRVASIHQTAEKGNSRKPTYRMLKPYALGPKRSPFLRSGPVLWSMHLATHLDRYSAKPS